MKSVHCGKLFIILILFICFLVILVSRIYPLLVYGEGGLGYDTGFYRRYLEVATNSFFKPPAALLGSESWGTRLILSILSASGFNTNLILFGSYILFSLLLGWMVFLLACRLFRNKAAGFFALALFALSPVQWLAYTYFLYKNFWAVVLLFFAFYLIERKSYFFIIPLFLSLVSHRTTAFLSGASLFLWGLFMAWQRKRFLISLIAFSSAILVIGLNWPLIKNLWNFWHTGLPDLDLFYFTTGDFINEQFWLWLVWPYALLGLFGFYLALKEKKSNLFIFFFLTNTFLVIFQSYFYQRILIYLDLCLIILGGGALGYLYQRIKSSYFYLVIAIIIFSLSFNLFLTIKDYQPPISQVEIQEIKKLRQIENESYVITYSTKYAPWLYGWAGPDKRIISPGLFDNKWNKAQWEEFWSADLTRQKQMLATYQAPLYIFNPESDFSQDICFKKFSSLIWRFECY